MACTSLSSCLPRTALRGLRALHPLLASPPNSPNPFGMNTYRNRISNPFRMNTYEKTGGGGTPHRRHSRSLLFTPIALYKGRTLPHFFAEHGTSSFLFLNSFRTLCTIQTHGKRRISLVFNLLRTLAKTM